MTPTFTVLIGSAGFDHREGASLRDSLASIKRQARIDGDQVIVAFDSYERDDEWAKQQIELVYAYGPGFQACAYNSGYHWYGIEQINHAMQTMGITGTHILTIGDDDVYVDGAFASLRRRCREAPNRPVLFRFVAPWRELLWDVPQMRISRISGCCIAAPSAYVDLFPTRRYIEHDFDWMQGILSRAAETLPDWWNTVLVIARPDARGDDVTHRGVLQCWHCGDWRYLEDVDVREAKCPKCGVVLDFPHQEVSMLGGRRRVGAQASA